MADRFDLEIDITNFYGIADDLDMLASAILESNLSDDDIANALTGLAVLTRLKTSKAFSSFTEVLQLDQYAPKKNDCCQDYK